MATPYHKKDKSKESLHVGFYKELQGHLEAKKNKRKKVPELANLLEKICAEFELSHEQRTELKGIISRISGAFDAFRHEFETKITLSVRRKNEPSVSSVSTGLGCALDEVIEKLERVLEIIDSDVVAFNKYISQEMENNSRLESISEYERHINNFYHAVKKARKKITRGRKAEQYDWFDYSTRWLAEFWRHSLNKKYTVDADGEESDAEIFSYAVYYYVMPDHITSSLLKPSMKRAKKLLSDKPKISEAAIEKALLGRAIR